MIVRAAKWIPSLRDELRLGLERRLLFAFALTYVVWWFAVEWWLPGSFNPIGSRLAIVAVFLGIAALSYVASSVRRHLAQWLFAALLLLTLHYFYLFYFNQANIDWVVGSYVTVIAVCTCLQTERGYKSYAVFVALLSVALCIADRALLGTIFLPGLFTVLVLGFVGLRARLRFLQYTLDTTVWFQNLFDAVFEAVVVHENGLVLEANDAFCLAFGVGREDVINQPLADFFAPESIAAMRSALDKPGGAPVAVTGLRPDGSRVPLEIRAKTHRLAGRHRELLAMCDVTARKASEQNRVLYEASQAALRMRDDFLSVASHELRTPLTHLKIQTQMAQRAMRRGSRDFADPERSKQFLEQTDRQLNRLTKLVDEMLDVSRIASGTLQLRYERFDCSELVREVVATFAPSLVDAGSLVETRLDRNVVVDADRFRLDQVVSNLLSNAVKYGRGQPITVVVTTDGAEAVIRVEDRGVGIEEADCLRIFERFERAGAPGGTAGLGLGLYISKYIVEALGGRITVESRRGEGSRFVVRLPRIAKDDVHVSASAPRAS